MQTDLHELLEISKPLAEKIAAYLAAKDAAHAARQAVVNSLEALVPADRLEDLMSLYWNAHEIGDKILTHAEVKALAGVETDAELRSLAKEFQPVQYQQCPTCNKPFGTKLYRNGRQLANVCKPCASAAFRGQEAELRKREAEEEMRRNERTACEKVLLQKAIREILQAEPMTKTKLMNRVWKHRDAQAFNPYANWEDVFQSLVDRKILLPTGQTRNGRVIISHYLHHYLQQAAA